MTETEPKPIACTLGADELPERLDRIAALGSKGLIGRESRDGGHILRFHADEETCRGLEEIIAAEAECCPFLDLQISERNGELLLALNAPKEGRPVADGLARAFSAKR